MQNPDGSAPLFRALTKPRLTAGLPDIVAKLLWLFVFTGAMAVQHHGLHISGAVVVVGIILHLIGAAATRYDPYFLLYVTRAMHRRRLDP